MSLLTGCGLFKDDDVGSPSDAAATACSETLAYLEQTAWPTVLGTNCADCHTPGGPALSEGSDFSLLPPGYPNFQERNLENLAKVAAYEVNDVSILLHKSKGDLDHGGGARVTAGSTEYKVLEELVARVKSATSCGGNATLPEFDDVGLLPASGTLRKAALHLAYRLPTSDETARASSEGEAGLSALIDGLMEEKQFYERLKDIFNERLLTERYLAYTGYAANILDDTMYPESGEPWEALTDDELREAINHSLADEPLDFIAYLVRNNKPFTDLVQGDYMVVNPLTAPYLNGAVEFDDPSDRTEFKEAERRAFVEVAAETFSLARIPSAGILTSPIFLNRFPTTETNRNRHRARMILDIFLGTDILEVGERPLDPTLAGLYPNPTQNDPSCASCHEILDPIAGAFQKFSDNDDERYTPTRTWYGEMLAAGFNGEQMPTSELDNAPLWLGRRIATDPRFPYAMVKIVYQGLMGREPLSYPKDFDAADHDARFAAWRAQESLFQAIGQKFVAADFNLRVIFRELILSPFYRARGLSSEPDEWRALEISGLGTERLSTPMLLARKIEAVTGLSWNRGWDRNDNLMTDYRILYGGIDSDTVTKALSVPNGVMASVAWRMANEVSCSVTSWDFYLPSEERRLFPLVTPEDAPETEGGDEVSAAVGRIKENIVHLHQRILGETLTLDDPEVERTYQLFLQTWREGQARMADEADNIGTGLPWQCRVREDRITGAELPEEARLEEDPLYTMRAWMAVTTYLLSDYKFIYE